MHKIKSTIVTANMLKTKLIS